MASTLSPCLGYALLGSDSVCAFPWYPTVVASSSTDSVTTLMPVCRELFASALKPREASLAIRTPSPLIDQDDTVGSLEGLRNVDRAAANSGNMKSGKALAIFQSRHRQLPKVDESAQYT